MAANGDAISEAACPSLVLPSQRGMSPGDTSTANASQNFLAQLGPGGKSGHVAADEMGIDTAALQVDLGRAVTKYVEGGGDFSDDESHCLAGNFIGLMREDRKLLAGDLAGARDAGEAQHDIAAIKIDEYLESVLNFVVQHPGQADQALDQLLAGLREMNQDLYAVIKDRKGDLAMQPGYIPRRDDPSDDPNVIDFNSP
jgi:hypothetical protein